MKDLNPKLDKTLAWMVYGSLMVLALGLVTSTSLLALSHILMAFPALYFLPKADYKKFPKSAWALLALTIVIMLSVLLNQDVAVHGYKPMFKAKYFLISFLSIAPLSWYFENHYDEKKISRLIYVFCISTSTATLGGMSGSFFGYNPFLLKSVELGVRNSGFFGMIMNYAHNMSYFLLIITGMIVFHEKIKKYVSLHFLIIVFVINFSGLYFSYTRGAWLAYFLGVPFLLLRQSKKIFLGGFALIALLSVIVYLVAGTNVIRGGSDTQRISQWKAAVAAFKDRPILGYGYLNFEPNSIEIKRKNNFGELNLASHAHNNFLEMLAGCGILGFLCYVFWTGSWALEGYRNFPIGMAFVVTFLVGGMTQSTISLGINLFFILAAFSIDKGLRLGRQASTLNN